MSYPKRKKDLLLAYQILWKFFSNSFGFSFHWIASLNSLENPFSSVFCISGRCAAEIQIFRCAHKIHSFFCNFTTWFWFTLPFIDHIRNVKKCCFLSDSILTWLLVLPLQIVIPPINIAITSSILVWLISSAFHLPLDGFFRSVIARANIPKSLSVIMSGSGTQIY